MNKSKIYTILGLVLSFMVIMGGWFFTKEMLQCKEAKILAGTGVISIVETAYPLEENFQPVLLSEDIMAEILKVWEAGGYIEYHEPKEGQMNMEQAIQAGGDWIDRMVENHILPKSLLSKGFESIGAVLCLVNNNQVLDYALNNNLLSCWEVRYKTREAEINLKIHAFSG